MNQFKTKVTVISVTKTNGKYSCQCFPFGDKSISVLLYEETENTAELFKIVRQFMNAIYLTMLNEGVQMIFEISCDKEIEQRVEMYFKGSLDIYGEVFFVSI